MPIVIDLLVQSKVLQDFLVDKSTGEALSAGTITLYKDNSRTELKNWYYQVGSYPNYSFITLPNPLVLSGAGTIVDGNGNDVLPFFYPVSEIDPKVPEFYYIVVQNSNGQMQFTRQNFPFMPNGGNDGNDIPTLQNLIINNRFWRSNGTENANGDFSITLTNSTESVICPSQHDGFSDPDFRFKKDATGAADIAQIRRFPVGSENFPGSIRPEYYLQHICSSTGSSEGTKYYQFPISLHLQTLDNVDAIFSIWTKANNTTGSNKLTISLYVYTGSGTGNTTSQTYLINTINPTTSWTQSQSFFKFPSTLGLIYDASEIQDSAYYLQIALETKTPLDVSFAIPSIYLGDTVPTTDFANYDEIDSIINSPRTGQQIESWASSICTGWIPSNNTSIGNSASSAIIKGGVTWPLYNLLWNNTTRSVCPVTASSLGTAKLDWEANKALTLPNTLGRTTASLDANVTDQTYTSATTVLTVVGGTTQYTVGDPVQVVGSSLGSLTANTVYYVTLITTNTIGLALTLELAFAGTPTTAGTGSGTIRNSLGVLQGASTSTAVPAHTHHFTSDGQFYGHVGTDLIQLGSQPQSEVTFNVPVTGTTDINSGSADINLFQPTFGINKFIKL